MDWSKGNAAQLFIQVAARKWKVPQDVLWGVYGIETDFGKDIATSSAGAMGPFQFLPSTATMATCDGKHYDYPLTNTPSIGQFTKQADNAAHYIHCLTVQHGGNLDAALRAYSGGGYGLQDVKDKAKGKNANVKDNPIAQVVGGVTSDPFGAIGDIASFFRMLAQASTWLRVGKVLLGALLILILGALLIKG